MLFSILNFAMLVLLTVALVCGWRYWRGHDPDKSLIMFVGVLTGAVSAAYVIILGFSAAITELARTAKAVGQVFIFLIS